MYLICKNTSCVPFFYLQKETLYKEVLYTITHKLGGSSKDQGAPNDITNQLLQLQQQGKPNALSAALAPLFQSVQAAASGDQSQQLSKDELFKYAKVAFKMDQETHNKLLEEVKDDKVNIQIKSPVLATLILSLYFLSSLQ